MKSPSKEKAPSPSKLPPGFIGRLETEMGIGETAADLDEYLMKHAGHDHFWYDVAMECEASAISGDPLKDCIDFCIWYPSPPELCAEFEALFPDYAVPPRPAEIENIYEIFNAARDNGIYSFWGPDFVAQVATLCAVPVSTEACGYLTAISLFTDEYVETSIKQLEHQF